MSLPIPLISPLPYPRLRILPQRHLAAYADLSGPGVPSPDNWPLDYSPEHEVGHISVREKGGAVFFAAERGEWRVQVFQRSSWFFNVYPWNLTLIITEEGGQHLIRKIELCDEVVGARGEACRRDYLLQNLRSHLEGRLINKELLSLNQALRIQCTHLVELVRYGVANFLQVMERLAAGGAGLPGAHGREDNLLFADSEITRIFRLQQDDVFMLQGTALEYWPSAKEGSAPGHLQYQLAIPQVQHSLGKTRSGSVKIKPFYAHLTGSLDGRPFQEGEELGNILGLDDFAMQVTGLAPYRWLATTLKDLPAYLSLGQLLNYPFTKGDQRSMYKEVVRKNSFCIGWKPALVDEEILKGLAETTPALATVGA